MNSFFEYHKDSIGWHYRCFEAHSAQWVDSAFPAAGAGRRLFQYVSTDATARGWPKPFLFRRRYARGCRVARGTTGVPCHLCTLRRRPTPLTCRRLFALSRRAPLQLDAVIQVVKTEASGLRADATSKSLMPIGTAGERDIIQYGEKMRDHGKIIPANSDP
jgi:hypothetical protein